MKLVTTIILVIHYAVKVNSNEQYVFPPKFQTPGTFVSESSLYLPPESHTPIPYFPVKKFGNLPFPYLPPTGTKAPIPFPPPFSMMFSSTRAPNFDDDDDNKNDDDRENKGPSSSPRPPFPYNRNNRTENHEEIMHKRDMRQIQKPMNYQQPIDRVDVRLPNQLSMGFSTPGPINQKPTPRSMIISGETHRNDNIFDQFKAGSSQSVHFVPPGGYISSTTEPAIPILRLSNEMDLDGSFSYEALGADQTHYVQHSHMENQGTEKEEQVVEGSYSYVGDNGQTYTVHYVADSNGFRASGDHLPVAPPVPEIIQRAIQYNLAEEAKKPPHLKSWQSEEQDRENNEFDKNQRFVIPPPRNLFTGRTPEAFSYDFAQRSPNMQNNIEAAASSQSVKTVDFTNTQQKQNINNGNIAPQVTFLASQGAVVPSANTPQQSVSRMFINEKPQPSLPQLVNYEADDNSKALWRWQYGLNSNNHMNNNANLNSEKNSISRSSGDDIVINFNEMTPEQYTNMLHSQLPSETEKNMDSSQRSYDSLPTSEKTIQNNDYEKNNPNENVNIYQNNEKNMLNPYMPTTKPQQPQDWYKPLVNNNSNNPYLQPAFQQNYSGNNYQENSIQEVTSTTSSNQDQKILSIHENNPRPQETFKQDPFKNHENFGLSTSGYSTTMNQDDVLINTHKFVTQEYNFEDANYEPRRIKALNQYTTAKSSYSNKNYVTNDDYTKINTPSYSTLNSIDFEKTTTFTTTQPPSITTGSNIQFTDFIAPDNKDSFKPIVKTMIEEKNQHLFDNVENSDLSNNIFLKNVFQSSKPEPMVLNKSKENIEKPVYKKVSAAETKSDKIAKYVNVQSKPFNDVTNTKKKAIDISEIMNYITMKNHFESSKLSKPKNNLLSFGNHKPRNEMHYLPVDNKEDVEESESYSPKQANNIMPNPYPHFGELRGNIKNYKVLQRNNNLSNGYENNQLKRELVPPPVKLLQSQNMPPLGRAGPSTRTYLPPIYV